MYRRGISILFALSVCTLLPTDTLAADASSTVHLRRKIRLHGTPEAEIPVVTAVAIQPNGNLVVTAGDDHLVRVWDLGSGRLIRELRGHRDWVTAVAFSPDGTKILSGCRDHQVLVWDATDGSLLGKLGEHTRAITSIVVAPQSGIVAITAFRAPLRLFDLSNRKLIASVQCPCSDVRAVAFSDDMELLAAAGRSGKIRVWNLADRSKRDIDAHTRRVTSLAFASNDNLLSAGEDNAIQSWNPFTGEKLRQFKTESGKVLSLKLIGNRYFATASADNVVRLFHLDGAGHQVLRGHTGSIASLDHRGNTLISGSFDTTVGIWNLPAVLAESRESVRDPVGERTISTGRQIGNQEELTN